MKTLIVDDNDINRKLLKALLEAEGFETILANDGKDALQLLEHQKADCIISDIMMPNVDGFALLYKIKQDDRFKNIIFILYSAKAAFHDDEKFAIKMGADKYLQKTGSSREIIHTIHELFSRMNLREDNEKLEYRKKIINKYIMPSNFPYKNEDILKQSIEELETEIERRKRKLQELKNDSN